MREEEEITPSTGEHKSNGKKSASLVNKSALHKENESINNENTINKITITVYQRRNNNIQNHSH